MYLIWLSVRLSRFYRFFFLLFFPLDFVARTFGEFVVDPSLALLVPKHTIHKGIVVDPSLALLVPKHTIQGVPINMGIQ